MTAHEAVVDVGRGRGGGSRREHVLPHRIARLSFDGQAVRTYAGIASDTTNPSGHGTGSST